MNEDPSRAEISPPWYPVDSKDRKVLESEFHREIPPGHPIWGRTARAFARRRDRDDVAFVLEDAPAAIAVVHLTWTQRRESDPQWPAAQLFQSLKDWTEHLKKCAQQEPQD